MLHKTDYVSDGVPVVNPMNIIDGRIVPSTKMMISSQKREELNQYVLSPGDVVIARRGEMGRCAVVTQKEQGWLCGTGSFFIKLKKIVVPEFFSVYFGSEKLKNELQSSSVGTTMDSLNHGILENLVIPIPPLHIQTQLMNAFAEFSTELKKYADSNNNKLAALTALKQALLAEVFGEG
jgi:type I restriction enzyme S subunit